MGAFKAGFKTDLKDLFFSDRKFLQDKFHEWIEKQDPECRPKNCASSFMAFLKHFCEGNLKIKEENGGRGEDNFKIGNEVIFVKGNCKGVEGIVNNIPPTPSALFGIKITNIDELVDKSINVKVGNIKQSWIEEFKLKGK